MKYEQTGFYDKSDMRAENRELALKLVFRELRALRAKPVDNILDKWKVREEEIGTRLSVAISFPAGLVRNQWFYDEKGRPYPKKHDGVERPAKKNLKKHSAKSK